MSKEVRVIKLDHDKKIYVEVEVDELDLSIPSVSSSDLPPGAETVGVVDDTMASVQLLRENISNMAQIVHESLSTMSPNEWSFEINIGFRGKVSTIPFIASGETQGAIKVCAKWIKE